MNFFEIVVAMLMAILTGYSAAPAAKTAAVTVEVPAAVAAARPQAVTRPKAAQPVAKPAQAAAQWPQPCDQAMYAGLSPAPTPYPGQGSSGDAGSVLTGTCPYLIVQSLSGAQMPNGQLIPSWRACFTPLAQPYTWQQRTCP